MSGNVTMTSINASAYCTDVFINESDIYTVTMNTVLIAVNAPFSFFAVVSNTLILFVIARTKELHTPPNILLGSLAITDFMVGIATQPLMMAWRVMLQSLDSTCTAKVVHMWYVVFLFTWTGGSFVNLSSISYDRFTAVSQPLKYNSSVTTMKVVQRLALVWVVWIVFVVLKYCLFTEHINQKLSTALAFCLVGFLVIIQLATIRCIRKNNGKIVAEHNAKIVYEREKRATFTIMSVLVALVVCLLPAVIVQTSIGFSDKNQGTIAMNFAILAILINSSANPVIYLWRNREIRKGCKSVLTCCQRTGLRHGSHETPRISSGNQEQIATSA